MKILVVGSGAMGCLYAALLERSGNEVWLLARRAETVAAIRAGGLVVEEAGAELQRPFARVADSAGEAGTADLVLVLVKSYDTAAAVKGAACAIGPHTTVVTLQNGLGNAERICDVVPEKQLVIGTTAHGATLLGPGRIRHAGKGETVIGVLDRQSADRAGAVRDLFAGAGIECRVSDDAAAILWAKLVVNCSINPLGAVLGCPNGKLAENPHARNLMQAAALECAAVASKLGIGLPYADPVEKVTAVCRATAGNICSMLQDVRAGKPTEIDALNGQVALQGQKAGVPVPVNSLLTQLVKSLEKVRKKA